MQSQSLSYKLFESLFFSRVFIFTFQHAFSPPFRLPVNAETVPGNVDFNEVALWVYTHKAAVALVICHEFAASGTVNRLLVVFQDSE
jgi:hypothetical protein